MSPRLEVLSQRLKDALGEALVSTTEAVGEIAIVVKPADLLRAAAMLRDAEGLRFEQLIDLCGVDYSGYGYGDGEAENALEHDQRDLPTRDAAAGDAGASLPATDDPDAAAALRSPAPPLSTRFAVVYHLLSISLNQRLRLRVFAADDAFPVVDSVVDIWPSANWYEREAFDLFGIVFQGHPDLRRILTDYGFIGNPFRKDFPLSGNVEMRYDPDQGRVIYQPVTIEPRMNVPRIVREEHYGDTDA